MLDGLEIRDDGLWLRLTFEEAGTLSGVVNNTCDNMAELAAAKEAKGQPAFGARGMLARLLPLQERLNAAAEKLREILAE
jgi:hypothetical protein